ncbi:hypothetical protein GOODEAATRI_001029 [Goodea atripinnis]|uniref:Uncharacterized protein n=1 Tax=Goodea atripinnis TaxID=208336 RepID=A0ABV0PUB6_9TELE
MTASLNLLLSICKRGGTSSWSSFKHSLAGPFRGPLCRQAANCSLGALHRDHKKPLKLPEREDCRELRA